MQWDEHPRGGLHHRHPDLGARQPELQIHQRRRRARRPQLHLQLHATGHRAPRQQQGLHLRRLQGPRPHQRAGLQLHPHPWCGALPRRPQLQQNPHHLHAPKQHATRQTRPRQSHRNRRHQPNPQPRPLRGPRLQVLTRLYARRRSQALKRPRKPPTSSTPTARPDRAVEVRHSCGHHRCSGGAVPPSAPLPSLQPLPADSHRPAQNRAVGRPPCPATPSVSGLVYRPFVPNSFPLRTFIP